MFLVCDLSSSMLWEIFKMGMCIWMWICVQFCSCVDPTVLMMSLQLVTVCMYKNGVYIIFVWKNVIFEWALLVLRFLCDHFFFLFLYLSLSTCITCCAWTRKPKLYEIWFVFMNTIKPIGCLFDHCFTMVRCLITVDYICSGCFLIRYTCIRGVIKKFVDWCDKINTY